MAIWPSRESRNSRTSRLRCAGNLSQTINEKEDGLFLADSLLEDLEVEVPECYSGSHGNAFPIEVILDHRRLTPRRPGTTAMRPLAQPAFVDEDDRAPFFFGFFLISGQVLRFQ